MYLNLRYISCFCGGKTMKKYKVIYADPPWTYKTWGKSKWGGSAVAHCPADG